MDRTFLTTLTLVLLTGSLSAVVIIGPEDALIENKSWANLTCVGNNMDLVLTVEWMKNGRSLSPSDRIQFSPDNTSILIQPVNRTDSGVYECTLNKNSSATYSLTVNYGPDVMVLGATRLEEGSDIVFHCWADSYPLVSINWTVNDKTVEDPQLILIPNCDSSNSGNYTCTAFNNITGITGSAQHFLTVTGKHSGGLSPGAAAGITAGVILGLEALIVLLFFLIMHFKKSSEPICTIPKPKKGKQKRKVSRSSTGLEFKNPNTTRATPKARTESRPATPLPAITRENKPKESIYENIRENQRMSLPVVLDFQNEVYCTTLPGR
ncbi:carcinoembryonic antigen-related cell adhesion molecule 20 isoform X1 [Astyanax mexicanus]|uniref:carcinoembryonic antigen-related cell adhesion molecule 20 isoform X1 n=1 Tax=Astyanax mexicanus TaxID=7994 RepID=UPI0020CAAC66|nr:carcinoembryonic antigen-related cell adhesion molecule 20 isoform X1 [Astyanax mexicanus]